MSLRRREREQMVGQRRLYRADLSVSPTAAEHNENLAAYLRSANVRIDSLSADRAAKVRLALLPDLNFVHFVAPPVLATWTRDEDSLDRVLIVVGRRGTMRAITEAEVITRDPQLILVPPGTAEVQFECTDEINEFFYLTMAPSVLEGISLRESACGDAPVAEEQLAPALAFIAALCRTSVCSDEQTDVVREAAVAVTRMIASLITAGNDNPAGLYTQAMDVITGEHARTELSASTIGERLHVSARTVQLAFRDRGRTVSGALRDVRVRAAQQLAQDNPTWTRAKLSRAVGFSSVSAYYRAVRDAQQQTR